MKIFITKKKKIEYKKFRNIKIEQVFSSVHQFGRRYTSTAHQMYARTYTQPTLTIDWLQIWRGKKCHKIRTKIAAIFLRIRKFFIHNFAPTFFRTSRQLLDNNLQRLLLLLHFSRFIFITFVYGAAGCPNFSQYLMHRVQIARFAFRYECFFFFQLNKLASCIWLKSLYRIVALLLSPHQTH